MTVRFPHKPISIPPDHVLHSYWRPKGQGFIRPTIPVGLKGRLELRHYEAKLDLGSPYILFEEADAKAIGLTPPFARAETAYGIGDGEVRITFPEDGEIFLFLSDYRTHYYVWRPLVGFCTSVVSTKPPAGEPKKTPTCLLGITGFFQFFDVLFHDDPARPEIEVRDRPTFPGWQGKWPPPPDFWESVRQDELARKHLEGVKNPPPRA